MFVRCFAVVVVCGACVSAASAAVTEISIFRQTSARARYGGITPTAAETVANGSVGYTLMGPFAEDRTAISPDTNMSARMHSTQNSMAGNGYYYGSLHTDGSAILNPSGTSDAASNYGSSPNTFQSTFSVAFSVDVVTMGRVYGNVSTSRTPTSSNAPASFLIGDALIPPGAPQPALLVVQPNAAGSPVNFDQVFTFLPGHRYSITASINMTLGGIFSSTSPVASADINFVAEIVPAPGAAGLLGMAGLVAMRRRRR